MGLPEAHVLSVEPPVATLVAAQPIITAHSQPVFQNNDYATLVAAQPMITAQSQPVFQNNDYADADAEYVATLRAKLVNNEKALRNVRCWKPFLFLCWPCMTSQERKLEGYCAQIEEVLRDPARRHAHFAERDRAHAQHNNCGGGGGRRGHLRGHGAGRMTTFAFIGL